MPQTLTFTDQLVAVTCWCGMHHAVPAPLRDHQLRQFDDGQEPVAIYCPLGHSHVPAGTPKAVRLEQQLERERTRAGQLAAARDQAEASARAYKSAATRARKRASAGVCPCCNRTFQQLARHMKAKHPDFSPEAAGDGVSCEPAEQT